MRIGKALDRASGHLLKPPTTAQDLFTLALHWQGCEHRMGQRVCADFRALERAQLCYLCDRERPHVWSNLPRHACPPRELFQRMLSLLVVEFAQEAVAVDVRTLLVRSRPLVGAPGRMKAASFDL